MKTFAFQALSPRPDRRSALRRVVLGVVLAAGSACGIAAHAAAGDAASAPPSMAKAERVVSDSWITTKVKSELLAASVNKGVRVHVKTLHGVVALKGKLPSQGAIDQYKLTAEKVRGVKSVDTSGLKVSAS
jgi:hyperosmotically inducible protein